MRPIEFRGLDCKSGNWVYGYIKTINKEYNTAVITEEGWRNLRESWIVELSSVGQYTGIKDKHGTKIFEGDIIASHGYTHIIEYKEQQARFVATRFEFSIESKDSCSLTKLWIDECDKVVVGNIHER